MAKAREPRLGSKLRFANPSRWLCCLVPCDMLGSGKLPAAFGARTLLLLRFRLVAD